MSTYKANTKSGARKFISSRKGEVSKSEVTRQLMREMSGKHTYKEMVDAIQKKTELSRMIAARYLRQNAERIEGFSTSDNKEL